MVTASATATRPKEDKAQAAPSEAPEEQAAEDPKAKGGKAKPPRRSPPMKEFDVMFRGMSSNNGKVRLAASISRETISLDTAATLFDFKYLELKAFSAGDDPQQGLLFEDAPYRLSAACEVRGFIFKKRIGVSLVFQENDVDAKDVMALAGKAGKLQIFTSADLSEGDETDGEDG